MISLKRFGISNSQAAGDGGTVKLLQSLANIHLHALTMDRIPMGHDDIMSLSHLIRPPGDLKELKVGDRHMQPDCVALLLKTVLSPSSLQTLYLIHMKMDGTSLLFSPLKDNCNVTSLQIGMCTIGSRIVSSIAEALCSNTTLEKLWLGRVSMTKFTYLFNSSGPVMVTSDTNEVNTNSAVRDLADALKVNRSLKELELNILRYYRTYTLAMGKEGARALVGALQCNQTLEELRIPNGDWFFSPEELAAMDSRVILKRSY